MKISDKLKNVKFELLKKFSDQIFCSNDQALIASGCNNLVEVFPILGMELTLSNIYRVRTDLSCPSKNIKELLWPPHYSSSNNRANASGEQLVYFSNHIHTCVEETRLPSSNALPVSVVSVKPKEKSTILLYPIGEIFHTIRTNSSRLANQEATNALLNLVKGLDSINSKKLMLIDAMILDAFNSDDRFISQSISSALFKKMPKEGMLFFSSRKHYGGLNYACTPCYLTEKFDIIGGLYCSEAYHVGYGIWEVNCSEYIKSISRNGNLRWRKTKKLFGKSKTKIVSFECFSLSMPIALNMGHTLNAE